LYQLSLLYLWLFQQGVLFHQFEVLQMLVFILLFHLEEFIQFDPFEKFDQFGR
jgi:hypothetical protein